MNNTPYPSGYDDQPTRVGPNNPDTTTPIPKKVTRYQCPHCDKTWSTKRICQEHINRCWRNPAARSCLTCNHYSEAEIDTYYFAAENCDTGHELYPRKDTPGLENRFVLGCPGWQQPE